MSDLLEVITRDVFEEYEEVRECGVVNMADYRGVMENSATMGQTALGELSRKEYYTLLRNYDELKDFYEGCSNE